MERTLRGKAAIVGIGETTYYKRGEASDPEFVLALKAVMTACKDAGIDPRSVDGFTSYSNERNTPARLAAALGTNELRFSNMVWGGTGGGASGAIANAAAAVATGMAECVVAYRSLAQGQYGRFGQGASRPAVSGDAAYSVPYGVLTPAQRSAMRTTRLMHERGIERSTMRSIALASYHHAQNNPRAVMHGRPLDAATYDEARWIVEPFRLYDCCLENDGAAALVIVAADRAGDFPHRPAYVLGAAQGSPHRAGATVHNQPDYATSSFKLCARRVYEMAGVGPSDVQAVQSYENFTGGVVMSLIEHDLCTYENANEVLTFENLVAPDGKIPLNTSGGNLAECYMHGLGLNLEAVRQVRGDSTNQVPDCDVVLVNSGPMVDNASNMIIGSAATL